MARPLKKITIDIKSRNASIDPKTVKFILKVSKFIARKLAREWTYYQDTESLAQDIVTDTLTAILTSNSFDPSKSEKQLYTYIKRTAESKTISLTRSFQKSVSRQVGIPKSEST